MAPEINEDQTSGTRTRHPKTDTFSFSLILFEILCGSKVFPSIMSAAVIMRKAMSWKAVDRPVIPTTVHSILQALIGRGWSTSPAKRPTFEMMWKQLRDIGFNVFPNVQVQFTPMAEPLFKGIAVLKGHQP
jgi:hypothetical protein